ncbi:MAG: heme-binding beta-barrel domain-containing protein [Proteobacteria bacterium]|nr:heme-binding beta-barrel domain-containing protein [Pseudomonadota bacterium]
MNDSDRKLLGPIAGLLGTWEGDKGSDRAPDKSRGVETNLFRERMVCEPTGLVQNHEQFLYGIRYRMTAWRIGEENAYHESMGYWLWDAATSQLMRCFLVPRGVSVIAGGPVQQSANQFSVSAQLGSPTYGICSGPFLHDEFRTTKYNYAVTMHGPDSFSYIEETHMLMKGRTEPFLHIDKNTLTKI